MDYESNDIFYLSSEYDSSFDEEPINTTKLNKNTVQSPINLKNDNIEFHPDSKNGQNNRKLYSDMNQLSHPIKKTQSENIIPNISKTSISSPPVNNPQSTESMPNIFDNDNFNCSPEKIDELRSRIESQVRISQNKIDDLKAKNDEKIASLKQNNQSKEQSLINSNDLEYRNLLWTITLKYLGRGCFTEDLEDLFQQSLNDKLFELEKELIELKQKNEEELIQLKLSLPAMEKLRKKPKRKTSHATFTPKEMAEIIYNKYFLQIQNSDSSNSICDKIDFLIDKLNNESTLLTTLDFKNPQSYFNYVPKRKKSKIQPKKSKYAVQNVQDRKIIQKHKEIFTGFEKTMKSTGKYIKGIQMKSIYPEMFPHFNPS